MRLISWLAISPVINTIARRGVSDAVPKFKRNAHWRHWAGSSVDVAKLAALAEKLVSELGDEGWIRITLDLPGEEHEYDSLSDSKWEPARLRLLVKSRTTSLLAPGQRIDEQSLGVRPALAGSRSSPCDWYSRCTDETRHLVPRRCVGTASSLRQSAIDCPLEPPSHLHNSIGERLGCVARMTEFRPYPGGGSTRRAVAPASVRRATSRSASALLKPYATTPPRSVSRLDSFRPSAVSARITLMTGIFFDSTATNTTEEAPPVDLASSPATNPCVCSNCSRC
jgi:hypothetical protein